MTVIAERLSCADVDAVSALLPVVGGTTTVPLVDGTQRVYANLDYAASAPALEAVAARVTEVLPLYASVHRGAGYLSQVSTALYESARQTDRAVRRRASRRRRDHHAQHHRLAQPARGRASRDGGRVLVLDVEHHANLLPWVQSSERPRQPHDDPADRRARSPRRSTRCAPSSRASRTRWSPSRARPT